MLPRRDEMIRHLGSGRFKRKENASRSALYRSRRDDDFRLFYEILFIAVWPSSIGLVSKSDTR